MGSESGFYTMSSLIMKITLILCSNFSSFRDSTYGEGGEGGMSQEDNYPPGIQHQNDQNGIESSIDQIFEGIISLSIIRVWLV